MQRYDIPQFGGPGPQPCDDGTWVYARVAQDEISIRDAKIIRLKNANCEAMAEIDALDVKLETAREHHAGLSEKYAEEVGKNVELRGVLEKVHSVTLKQNGVAYSGRGACNVCGMPLNMHKDWCYWPDLLKALGGE